MPVYGFYAGLAVIALLSAVALYLHWLLYRQRQAQKREQQRLDEEHRQVRETWNQSLQILCRALLEGQVDCVEASIRIAAIMDRLAVPADLRQEFVAFDKLAQSVAHIPILDAWKQLPKPQRREYEAHMAQQEASFGDFVRDAAQRMLGRQL